ncbi:hypothetical protein JCM10213v2_000463 [Rhodosporidiobolus nylandii]
MASSDKKQVRHPSLPPPTADVEAVVSALEELGNAFGALRKAHGTAQSAILEYAHEIDNSTDPTALLAQFPALIGGLEGVAGSTGKAGAADQEDGEPKKRKRGPNKEKKVKDPNAPKRPASAYIEYQNSVREEFRKQYSDLPYSEVLKKIGLVWQGMSDAEKKPWNEITDSKKAVYIRDKEAYEAENGGAVASTPATQEEKAPYTGKKRGRKSNAEKAAMAAAEGRAGDIPVEDPKEKKKVKAASPKPKKTIAPAPAEESDSEESDSGSDEDSEEEEEDEESSESEPEAAPPAKQKKDKHKSKKSKH